MARNIHFQPHPNSGLQHREHRSSKGRDIDYNRKRLARLLRKKRLQKILEREESEFTFYSKK